MYISPRVFLRVVWSILWATFRHPFTTTYIDAATGRDLGPRPGAG